MGERSRTQVASAQGREFSGFGRVIGVQSHADRHWRMRPGRSVRYLAISPDQKPARARFHAECIRRHLGDVQELSVSAREVPGDSVGADWNLHYLLFWRT